MCRYACHADDLVNDFVSLTSLVTKESLQTLEASYNQSQGVPTGISFPQMQQAASRFLGRFWAGSNGSTHNSVKLSPNRISTSNSSIRRSTSKQSMTSTLNSVESASDASTAPTELSAEPTQKPRAKSAMTPHKDRDLHTQIEDLLMALSDLQRQHADLSRDLQLEREEREEDQSLAKSLLHHVKERSGDEEDPAITELLTKAEERFGAADNTTPKPESATNDQTKQQLRDDLHRWKEMHQVESSRCLDLTRRIDEQEQEGSSLREQIREARSRIQDGYRDRQRLERMVRELRSIKTPISEKPPETPVDQTPWSPASDHSPTSGGLRELKLVRSNSQKTTRRTSTFSKRSSSLGLKTVLSTENNAPAPEESLLLELVNAKTAEAVAKQELEEVKGKMESLRKMVSGQQRSSGESRLSLVSGVGTGPGIAKAQTEPVNSGGFWGWGRRAVSGSQGEVEAK